MKQMLLEREDKMESIFKADGRKCWLRIQLSRHDFRATGAEAVKLKCIPVVKGRGTADINDHSSRREYD